MTSCHPAALPIDELLADCDERRLRRGGPGGQHRNKVETAVQILHRPTGVVAEASERRSQSENRAVAIRRLRLKLAVAVRGPVSTEAEPAPPSDLWRRRAPAGRIAVNPAHDDFPALLAEALDTVARAEFDLSAAAAWLGVSASQLARLLRDEPPAWALVNDARRARGLRPLH